MNKVSKAGAGIVMGAPPTLEWISVEQLQVDSVYQRTIESPASRRIIFGMVRCWDWRLCQPLNVSRRGDSALFVVDGPHRLAGARERGDIPHLPCVVTMHGDQAEEANTFVALNQKRQRLSQGEVFTASLASGDPDAARVAELVARAGLRFARSSNTDRWEPGQIFCGPMLGKALRAHGDAVIANALVAMAEAFGDKRVTSSATLLNALILVYSEDARRPGFDPDAFIEALGSIEPQAWPDLGRDARRMNPALSVREALALAMMDEYDAQRGAAL